MFKGFEEFINMGMGMNMGRQGPMKGQDIFLNLELSFFEAVNGCKKTITLEKKGVCSTCRGSKCKPGTAPSKCFTCGGRGIVNMRQGPMTLQMTCQQCKGTGATVKHPCTDCSGTGIQNKKQSEEITIPKGINNGQSIRMGGKVIFFSLSRVFIYAKNRVMLVKKEDHQGISLSKSMLSQIHISEEKDLISIQTAI